MYKTLATVVRPVSWVLCGLPLIGIACSHITDTGAGPSSSSSSGGSGSGSSSGSGGSGGACGDAVYSDAWTPGVGYKPDPAIASQVQTIVQAMTPLQLSLQMSGSDPMMGTNTSNIFSTQDDKTAGVAGFHFRDGPRGVCIYAEIPTDKTTGNPLPGYSTAFPVPEARGAAFDMALEEQIGEAIGDETLASIDPTSGTHNTMLLAPVINILRHPAWGRAQETYGEDSYQLGRLGSAFVTGAQKYVPACAKHYAAYDIEDNRASNVAEMDEQTLREEYTRHFGVLVEDTGVSCLMAAYNLIQDDPGPAVKATEDTHLLTDILRGDFQFTGFVLSDWWAMPPGANGATTDALAANAIAGVNAGLDMELPWSYNYAQLPEVTGQGKPLSMSQLQTSAARIITQKFRFKVGSLTGTPGLATPTTGFDTSTWSITNNDAHIALAETAAEEGTVLLKNDNKTLPIDPTKVKTIAVLGAVVPSVLAGIENDMVDFSTTIRLGDLGSSRVYSDPAKTVGPVAGIQQAAGSGIKVVGGNTAASASGADFIVVVAGLTAQDEGEEYTGAGDRTSFALDAKQTGAAQTAQNDLITAAAALNKPMVVVLEGGAVIDMPWLAQVPAVVMAWYPGQMGGQAIGKLLFGAANFSGKLPMTWPKQWADEPTFSSGTTTKFNYYVGYKYFDNTGTAPLYAFGHGLSYTTFAYDNISVPCPMGVSSNAVVNVTVDVTNSGTVAGDETTFLFVSYPGSTARRPMKELKSFARTSLMPGEKKTVTLPIRVSDLKYWDTSGSGAWHAQSGSVKVMVGGSSDNLPQTGMFTVN